MHAAADANPGTHPTRTTLPDPQPRRLSNLFPAAAVAGREKAAGMRRLGIMVTLYPRVLGYDRDYWPSGRLWLGSLVERLLSTSQAKSNEVRSNNTL